MPRYSPKPDPFKKKPSTPMNIVEVWGSHKDPHPADVPKPNRIGNANYSRLLHNLENLSNLYDTVPLDDKAVELLIKKVQPITDSNICRQMIVLNLISHTNDLFQITVHVIPLFLDGILVSYLFACCSQDQELILRYRSLSKPRDYEQEFIYRESDYR